MRFNPVPLIAVLLFSFHASFSQVPGTARQEDRYRLFLKSGSFTPSENITDSALMPINKLAQRPGGRTLVVIQFLSIPTPQERQLLRAQGIELLDYIPNHAYTATVTGSLNPILLNRVRARAIIELKPEQKMQPALANGNYPRRSVKTPNSIDVWIRYPRVYSFETVMKEMQDRGFQLLSTDFKRSQVLVLRVSVSRLKELASLPFIEYVQAAPGEDKPINDESTTDARTNILNSSAPGGRNLRGENIVMGIGDDANPLQHADFNDRVINRSPSPGGSHGVHVMGTAGSGGIVRERLAGHAPKADLVIQRFSGILQYAPTYVMDHGMVITNNSYGNIVDDCATFGVYDLYSSILDQDAYLMPNLQQVFSAGNSGGFSCSPYLPGFSTVLGSYQSSKNTVSVGYTDDMGNIVATSSKGPLRDGRIKPEVTAFGTNVFSTVPTNAYGFSSGTSMAAPAVSGGLALLYERYKQLNGNSNPKNGLMKALLCNGATDKGNAGPDFSYGFGWLNLLRSVTMLENASYFNTSVNSGGTNTHNLTIPAGSSIAQLKVMLYWNDSAAAPLASSALVNDLDLEVTDPLSTIHYPQLLNAAPANVNDPATTGADHVNNIEQAVIANPAPGNYTFSVKGTTIPSGTNHEYFLVFDTLPVSTTITYPAGGERLTQGDVINIHWDSYGNPSNDFTLEYSTDDGATWTNIVSNLSASLRQYNWTIPAVAATSQAKVKVIHNGTGLESISGAFTIIGVPAFILSGTQCEGYIATQWPAVTGATDYDVMMLQGDEMVIMATTTGLNYTLKGLSKDSLYWVSVRARINGQPGRRANARSRIPNSGTCNGAISDNDLKVDYILSPVKSGRMLTSTQLSGTTTITIRIENLDNAATTGNIPVSYIIGNNPPVTETIIAPNIASRASYDYSFATPADLSAVGTYPIKASVSYAGDPVVKNDTLAVVFKQLANSAINLATPFLDDLEAGAVQAHNRAQVGLQGLDRYDFASNTSFGQIRTFINTGIAYSGSKALTLDSDRFNAGGTTDSLTGTFNLASYNTAANDIRLDFRFKHHGQVSHPANKVWIRGDDQKNWIQVYDLFANQEDAGLFKRSSSIEVSDILAAAIPAQSLTSSFQVRWGQWGQILAADNETGAGYTFDDIRLYEVFDDIQMISIDTPVVASCGLGNTVPVAVTVRNSANSTISSIPVVLQVDGGAPVTEIISSIPGNTAVQYTFTATANLNTLGNHTIKTWVNLASDTYRDNDTATLTIYNAPVVTSFPHLQDFESGDGSWHTGGRKSSWQYGTPASPDINRAASGTKAWKTNLDGNYNDLEFSYLYSPCYDISGLTRPMLSFHVALDIEDCGAFYCDGAYVEYSSDGTNWMRLGSVGAGTNWYNRAYGGSHLWSVQDYERWHVATIPLPTALNRLRLRFVMQSDPFVTREGMSIDDIHIYDSTFSIYDGPPYTSPVVTQSSVNGNNWIDFISSGKIIASVNPNGMNMGSTDARVYINTGAVRTSSGQYYLDRNITIKPANINLADSARVRFYFLDSESENLINAAGCGSCTKPNMALELGVTKHSNPDINKENGSLNDNTGGTNLFKVPSSVSKIPFDKGYYAEFNVKDFSEFWLNNGGPASNQALPVQLVSFNAAKNSDNDVVADWITSSEFNTSHFEIELAKGNDEYNQNRFRKIGEVAARGNSDKEQKYQFIDRENEKSGVRFYRLKMVDVDGRFSYSPIRAVVFNDEIKWQAYPNPSSGIYQVVYQAPEGEKVVMRIFDANGKQVQALQIRANAFIQKTIIDLGSSQYASGMYLLEIGAGNRKQMIRLIKK